MQKMIPSSNTPDLYDIKVVNLTDNQPDGSIQSQKGEDNIKPGDTPSLQLQRELATAASDHQSTPSDSFLTECGESTKGGCIHADGIAS
jgi:hypothetical protein